ncbi:MAG: hypothetical protein QF752_10300 [Planctomycetota bacterium]|nr:hypothetical protein [Planctomycetota bacterium]
MNGTDLKTTAYGEGPSAHEEADPRPSEPVSRKESGIFGNHPSSTETVGSHWPAPPKALSMLEEPREEGEKRQLSVWDEQPANNGESGASWAVPVQRNKRFSLFHATLTLVLAAMVAWMFLELRAQEVKFQARDHATMEAIQRLDQLQQRSIEGVNSQRVEYLEDRKEIQSQMSMIADSVVDVDKRWGQIDSMPVIRSLRDRMKSDLHSTHSNFEDLQSRFGKFEKRMGQVEKNLNEGGPLVRSGELEQIVEASVEVQSRLARQMSNLQQAIFSNEQSVTARTGELNQELKQLGDSIRDRDKRYSSQMKKLENRLAALGNSVSEQLRIAEDQGARLKEDFQGLRKIFDTKERVKKGRLEKLEETVATLGMDVEADGRKGQDRLETLTKQIQNLKAVGGQRTEKGDSSFRDLLEKIEKRLTEIEKIVWQ